MIKNKIHKFKLSLLKETFLKDINNESLLLETKQMIFESYYYRVKNNLSQKQFSELVGLKLQTVKRIELGKCYDLKLLGNYFTKVKGIRL